MSRKREVQYVANVIFPDGTPVTSLPITEHGIELEARLYMAMFQEHKRKMAEHQKEGATA